MPSLPAGTFPSTYDNNQYTSLEKNPGTGYFTVAGSGASSYFDGPNTGSDDWISGVVTAPGTNDFTVEMWINPTTNSPSPYDINGIFQIQQNAFGSTGYWGTAGFGMYTRGGAYNTWSILLGGTFTTSYTNALLLPTTGSWTHVAYIRTGGKSRIFVGGQAVVEAADTTDYSSENKLAIGGAYNTTNGTFNGYISNFRYHIGTSPYTITVPSGGSSSFPQGASDVLTASSFPALNADDWTVEFWWRSTHTFQMGFIQVGKDNGSLSIYMNGSNKIVVEGNQTGSGYTSAKSLVTNRWYHIAVVNDGTANTQTTYINGVADTNTGSRSTAYTYTEDTVIIGGRYYSSAYKDTAMTHMSNVRITKAKVYSANFVVPTEPLTAIANCQLLTCQNSSSSITDASSNSLTIGSPGNVVATSTQFPFMGSITPPSAELTDISGTALLTCQNGTGSITDASSNNVTLTANGDVVANTASPFGSGGTTASVRMIGFDSAGSSERFNNGTIYGILNNGLLARVATRDSHAGFELNVGDSGVAGAGEISPLIAFDSANSVERYTQGTLYHEQVPAPGNNPGILVKMLTRDSLGGGNAATQSAATAYAMNVGDSSIGNIVGARARLLREDSANGVGIYNTGSIYGDVQKTALNTLLSTRSPRTNFKGNVGALADSSGGGVGGVAGGGSITYTEILLNF